MSASRERRQRQADPQRAMTQKERAELKEQKAAKQKTVLYAAIGVIVAILVVILLVWDSGIFQRAQTAMSIAGRDYKVTDVEYYYRSALNQEYTLSMYGMSSFDNSVDPAEQYRDEAQTQTYRDYFLEQATTALKAAAALENSAVGRNRSGRSLRTWLTTGTKPSLSLMESRVSSVFFLSSGSSVM